jgi:chorismate dehydratase
VTFLGDTAPARCAQMLAQGLCDVALIPVIEYQRIPDLRIIPDIAVASKNRVRSVVLATRLPPSEVRVVTLDSSSRTSQALLRILFRYRYGAEPTFSERTPDAARACSNMFEGSDAALVIGDPAMRLGELKVQIYDLAEEWRAMTGLPFVFAVWASTEAGSIAFPEMSARLLEAKAEGLARIDEIAAEYSLELQLPVSEVRAYLRENVNYDLDAENVAGMLRFFSLARECGLISEELPLIF